MNNHGSGSGMRSSAAQGKQIGKTGLDFNLTQPIQLTGNMNSGSHTTGSKANGNFVQTQAGLQKILRNLNKQQTAAAVAAMLQGNNNNASQNEAKSASQQQAAAQASGSQSAKNMSGVSQRKSSSNKSRRIDLTANPSGSHSNSKSAAGTAHVNQPSIQSNEAGGSSKGRPLMKGSLGESLPISKGKSSRNPRQVDGMPVLPPPSQSNTNPIVPSSNSFNLNQGPHIAPSLGTESGGGHTANLPTNVARSASGKRLHRGSDQHGVPTHQNKHSNQSQGGSSKYAQHTNQQQESRFLQPAMTGNKVLYTEPVASNAAVVGSAPTQNMMTEAGNQSNNQPGAKYFSQRIQNQLKGPAPVDNLASSSQGTRTSKEELLRAYIKPGPSDKDTSANEDGTKAQPRQTSINSSNVADQQHDSTKLKQRLVQRQSGKATGGLNELGGFNGASLEKIQAKASKMKQNLVEGGGAADDNSSAKNALPQAANSFRAKLLRQQDKSDGSSQSVGKTQSINKIIKDEPQIIQNALNSLKKNLIAKENKETGKPKPSKQPVKPNYRVLKANEEAKRRDEEKNLGPDDIVEYRGMKMTMSQREEYMEMEEEQIVKFRQNYYPAKYASKKNGVVVTYAANTHQGMVRSYNEDRVSIILNIIKPKFKQIDFWPRCSFFAIYDGHGGAQCADFLRDQLHQMIVRDSEFPQNPIKAMQRGFEQAEKSFLEFAHNESQQDGGSVQRSGSCAIVILIVGDVCYVANVGDSRAFMSTDAGTKIVQLSEDHKPECKSEQDRIEGNGGKVYQNQSYIPDPSPGNNSGTQTLIGPHRVFPGRLSVSRTIGDIEAKDERYGGNPKVVIAVPEIRAFKIKDNYDFIAIGCDGVFEKMDNQPIMDQVWEASLQAEDLKQPMTIHARCGQSVDGVLNECVNQKTLDNITAVIIGFSNFEKLVDRARTTGGRNDLIRDANVMAEDVQLDWEEEMASIAEIDPTNIMNKLAKPLEPVEEEMIENSELETPLSEVIDISRKKLASRGGQRPGDNGDPDSHTSSVSERYVDSSRRQSQLLETQDTTNLIDHDLPTVNIINSKKHLRNQATVASADNVDQAQRNAPIEDQQAGKEQQKSAAQIGLGSEQQNQSDSHSLLPQLGSGEQGFTKAVHGVQKDYKIRQTSASPARLQRQNSDRTVRRQPESQPHLLRQAAENKINPGTNQLTQGAHNSANTGNYMPQSNAPSIVPRSSAAIPVTRTSKTPIHPSGAKATSQIVTRNIVDIKGQLSQPQQQHQKLSHPGRPITPKRIVAAQKSGSQQQQSHPNHMIENTVLRNSSKELPPHSAGNVIGSGTISTTTKTNRNSARRRDENKRQNEDVGSGKLLNKKMAQNWVVDGTQGNQNQSFISHGMGAHNAGSFHSVGAPPSSKAMNNMAKNYITNLGSINSKSGMMSLPGTAGKNRTQRVNETIKGLISNTQNNMMSSGHQTAVHELLKDQQNAEMQAQFNSFNGHHVKQGLMQQDQQQQKSSSNPPVRHRKKSGGKVNLGNNAVVRQTSMNTTQQVNSGEHMGPNFHLPTTTQASVKQQQQQRTSASRNKPSYLHPVVANTAAGSNSYQGGHQSQPAPASITLNMNQINLTTGSNRVAAQHHPQMSQPNNSNFASVGGANNGGQPSRYSNTVNLSGIKHLSNQVLSNKPGQQGNVPTKQIKRMRD